MDRLIHRSVNHHSIDLSIDQSIIIRSIYRSIDRSIDPSISHSSFDLSIDRSIDRLSDRSIDGKGTKNGYTRNSRCHNNEMLNAFVDSTILTRSKRCAAATAAVWVTPRALQRPRHHRRLYMTKTAREIWFLKNPFLPSPRSLWSFGMHGQTFERWINARWIG